MQMDGSVHLYCLALSRFDHDGSDITPGQRNEYKFHFRHFKSRDGGNTWLDKGAVLHPANIEDGNDAGNVWSGGVLPLEDGRVLFGFTGIADKSTDHPFVQSINIAIGTSEGPSVFAKRAHSHPIRDRQKIIDAGYYLPPIDEIGHVSGEADGPITAWRDPYFYKHDDGNIYAFWSAKLGPSRPAVAWAKISIDGDNIVLELLPPIALPDDQEYTQAEVPKIAKDSVSGIYYMLISACSRIDETQADEEVFKQLRLYKSRSLNGPWKRYSATSNILSNMENLFGASFIDSKFKGNEFRLIAPYTERANSDLELTFAPPQTFKL